MTPKGEIGSEFHSMPFGTGSGVVLPMGVSDWTFTFSGRTAIETVLKNESQIRKAVLPAYCCDSMIEPFRRLGINVSFFFVNNSNGLDVNISSLDDADCVLWCNYFGFKHQMPDFSSFIKRGGIVIEDISHSFYSINQYHNQSTYIVASIRKWMPINCGGYCASVSDKIIGKPTDNPPRAFVEQKRKAMERKAAYLQGDASIDKLQFLNDYARSNAWIAENYSNLIIDNDSERYISLANQDDEKMQRINNAKRLYKGIRTSEMINFLFDEKQMDCPLFVPVIIQNGKRDAICRRLINKGIYCPIHWPHPKADCRSNLYDTELSLICDQRYTEDDMDYIVSVFNEVSGY